MARRRVSSLTQPVEGACVLGTTALQPVPQVCTGEAIGVGSSTDKLGDLRQVT